MERRVPNMMKLAILTDSTAHAVWSGASVRASARSREAWMPERIFVVGHAAVTCLGRDMDSTWQGLVEGRSGIRRHAALRQRGVPAGSGRDGRGVRAGHRDGGSGDRQALGAVPSPGDGGGARGVCRCGAGPEGRVDRSASGGGRDRLGVRRARSARRRAGADEPTGGAWRRARTWSRG